MRKKSILFAYMKKKQYFCARFWKDGRVVYCVGLENRSTERYRGFESLSFRKKDAARRPYFFIWNGNDPIRLPSQKKSMV